MSESSLNRRPKRSPAKPARVDLIPEEFDYLVEDQGVFARITPSMLCPNRDLQAGTNHILDCDVCHGDEVVDLDDKSFQEWVFVQGIDFSRNFDSQLWDVKDAKISVKSNVRIGYWYKIEMLDHASIFNEILTRGTDDDADFDKLRYVPVNAPDHNWYLIDADNNKYEIDVDYEKEDQGIRWLTGNRPTTNRVFSIIYPVLPTFRVLELVHDNRYYYKSLKRTDKMPVNLPQQAVIRWDYMANRSGSQELVRTEE